MAKMIFEIDDKLEERFRNAILQRKGWKRGVLKEALIEAMNLWIEKDVLKNLKSKAEENITETDFKNIVNAIGSRGKAGITTLSELVHKPYITTSELEYITNTIEELSKQKESI